MLAIKLLSLLLISGSVPQDDAILFKGTGAYSRKITTKSPLAQKYYDQGWAFLYGFNHDEAIRSFTAATKADPECAMAWWGLAMANGPHVNNSSVPPEREEAGTDAILNALRFKDRQINGFPAGPKSVEIALIEAGHLRFNRSWGNLSESPEDWNRPTLDKRFATAMNKVFKQFPNDVDVVILYAESLMDLQPWDYWNADGSPKGNTNVITKLIDHALTLNPRHPQACHLAIHAWEASPYPEKATVAADALRDLQPALGHMVHMPSHTDVRVGSWAKAVLANEKAIVADDAYGKVRPKIGFYRVYMAHNRHMLGHAAMMTGQGAKAIDAMDKMAAAVPPETIKDSPGMVDGIMGMPYEVRIRFGRWDEILSMPPPPAGLPLAKTLYHMARGIAAAAKGDFARAREEEKLFLVAKSLTTSSLLGVAEPLLRGEILVQEGKLDEGIAELKKAVAAEDLLPYNEPPDWINPCRHPLGAALMKAGRFAEAEAVYREDLRRLPNNGWSLYGLSQALAKQSKTKEARDASEMFTKAWKDADTQITSSCMCLPGK